MQASPQAPGTLCRGPSLKKQPMLLRTFANVTRDTCSRRDARKGASRNIEASQTRPSRIAWNVCVI